jgi:hypothetical protein
MHNSVCAAENNHAGATRLRRGRCPFSAQIERSAMPRGRRGAVPQEVTEEADVLSGQWRRLGQQFGRHCLLTPL